MRGVLACSGNCAWAYMMTATPTMQMKRPADVITVRAEPVRQHRPRQRTRDERGEDAPEVRVLLHDRNESVRAHGQDAGPDPDPAAVFTHALPDQPAAVYLGEGGDDEQELGVDDGHGLMFAEEGEAPGLSMAGWRAEPRCGSVNSREAQRAATRARVPVLRHRSDAEVGGGYR
jgi:hypothetical protein